jgi:hypothetical protein
MTLGKDLPVDVLKSHAARESPAPSLPQRISQGSPCASQSGDNLTSRLLNTLSPISHYVSRSFEKEATHGRERGAVP